MNSYFLCVTQPTNAGDLLINRMLIEELSLYGKVYVDCYNCPESFTSILVGHSDNIIDVYKTFGFSLKRGSFMRFFRLLRNHNIRLYTHSPGPLNRVTNLPSWFCFKIIRGILSLSKVSFIRIGNCCSAAMATGTNVLESKSVEYYVRSRKGVIFLNKFRKEGIDYIPDLAFLYKRHVNYCEKSRIALMSFRQVTENLEGFVDWVKNCVCILQDNGYEVLFYHQVKCDFSFMKYLYDELGNDNIQFRSEILWYDDFSFYADKSIVVSNRLHCLLMGIVYNAVPLAYVDGEKKIQKIKDVFESSMFSKSNNYITDYTSNNKLVDLVSRMTFHQMIIRDIVKDNFETCYNTIKRIVERLDM